MDILITHLSDIHVRKSISENAIEQFCKAISTLLSNSLSGCRELVIVVTGDIAESGQPEQFEAATRLFEQLAASIRSKNDVNLSFVTCPGNHDCNFATEKASRRLVIDAISAGNTEVDESVVSTCIDVQQDYLVFEDKFSAARTRKGLLTKSHVLEVDGSRIVFDSLNTSWLSTMKDHKDVRYYPISDLHQTDTADLCIALMHHPESWFASSASRTLRAAVSSSYHFVFAGHEHEEFYRQISSLGNKSSSVFIDGGKIELDADKVLLSSINIMAISLKERRYSVTKPNLMAPLETRFEDWFEFPSPGHSPLDRLSESFRSWLDDPGIGLLHPRKRNPSFSDLFIEPELVQVKDSTRAIFAHSEPRKGLDILGELQEYDCLIISGDDYSGKTTLAKAFFLETIENGFVPLILNRDKINNLRVNRIPNTIGTTLRNQYKSIETSRFHEAQLAKRLAILDHVTLEVLGKTVFEKVLDELHRHFGKIVIFCGEVSVLETLMASEAISKSITYRLEEFGNSKRTELVERWCRLGMRGEFDEEELYTKTKVVRRNLDEILESNLLASFPVYLLILLQTIESFSDSDTAISNGHLFESLITSRLQEAAGSTNLDILYSLLSHLAQKLSDGEPTVLSLHDFQELIDWFGKEHYLNLDSEKLLKRLVRSKILAASDEGVSFKYPYYYYYFRARNIHKNLCSQDRSALIETFVNSLHTEESTSTIVFLAHLGSAAEIAQKITCFLGKIRPNKNTLCMETDSEIYKSIYVDLPKRISIELGDYRENRREHDKILDKLSRDQKNDEMLKRNRRDREAYVDALDLSKLYKGINLLGEVLKGSPGTLNASQKRDLTTCSRDSAVKFINIVIELFELDFSGIQKRIADKIEEGGALSKAEMEKIGRQIIGFHLEQYSLVILRKASKCLARDHLVPIIRDLIDNVSDVYARLIGILAAQEVFNKYPSKEVQNLAGGLKHKNLFEFNILRFGVMRHMILENMDHRAKRIVANALDINFVKADKIGAIARRT